MSGHTLLPANAILINGSSTYYATPDGFIWSTRQSPLNHGYRLKGTPNSRGYLWVRVDGKRYATHILICETFHGPRPFPEAVVRHLNDIQTDNAFDNVVWGTLLENSQDRTRNGNVPKGTSHGLAILTDENIREIRTLRAANVKQREVARRFGVHHTTIRKIERGLTWQQVV
jgi:hypothetical protein